MWREEDFGKNSINSHKRQAPQELIVFKTYYLKHTTYKIMQEAYIVAGSRTAIGKSKRGGFRFTTPVDLAYYAITDLMKKVPNLVSCTCRSIS
jgi:hypothetical protein